MENTETRQAALRAAMEESRWDVVAYLIVSGIEGVQKRLRAVIAADKARGRYADIDDAFNEQPAPTKDFVDHLKRRAEREPAVKAALESRDEQPAPATAGDVPGWCVDRIRGLVGIWERDRDACYPHDAIKAVKWLLDKAESEIACRVAEATKNRDAETQKARRLALEWGDKLTQRDAEIERLTKFHTEAQSAINRLRIEANAEIKLLKQELSALRGFKSYVHSRLDAFSVPSDPNPGDTAKTGCRIGERLNWLFREFNRYVGESDRLKAQLTKWESEPVGKMITELRDDERESKNADIKKLRSKIDELLNENAANVEENDRLRAELAANTPGALASARDVIRALQAELADERQQRVIYESELSNLAGFVQEMHTIGEAKAIGLREAVSAVKQVVVKLQAELAESRKSGRAACESLADCIALKDKRTEERDKLKAELAEAKKRALPAGWEMSGTMVSRQDECERLNEENATLREQLAEATKPVEDEEVKQASKWNAHYFRDEDIVMHIDVVNGFLQRERAARLAAERDSKDASKWLWKFGDAVGCDGGWGSILNEVIALRLRAEAATTKPVDFESARTVELDGMKMIHLGDAQAAVRCERAARLAAEQRLTLTREAWRHRWADTNGNCPRDENYILTDADIDAAIAAHEKSKADAAGGGA